MTVVTARNYPRILVFETWIRVIAIINSYIKDATVNGRVKVIMNLMIIDDSEVCGKFIGQSRCNRNKNWSPVFQKTQVFFSFQKTKRLTFPYLMISFYLGHRWLSC